MNTELERKLRLLRVSGFVQALAVRNQEAINNHLAYVEFLELLVEDELARRRDLLFQRRLKQAQMPQLKSLDDFDWSFNLKLPKQLVLDLATLRFISERGGALIIGAAGLGKSHICVSIGVRAIEAGYTVLYRSAFDLAEDLSEAAATGTRKDLIGRLTRVDLLILEDLGARTLPPTAAEDLLEIFTRRYETGATILTSNRPIEDFGVVLGDNVAAGVLLDRFLHHAEIVQLQGRSFRIHERQQRHAKTDSAPSDKVPSVASRWRRGATGFLELRFPGSSTGSLVSSRFCAGRAAATTATSCRYAALSASFGGQWIGPLRWLVLT
jgi:DNA replication protein DnaC